VLGSNMKEGTVAAAIRAYEDRLKAAQRRPACTVKPAEAHRPHAWVEVGSLNTRHSSVAATVQALQSHTGSRPAGCSKHVLPAGASYDLGPNLQSFESRPVSWRAAPGAKKHEDELDDDCAVSTACTGPIVTRGSCVRHVAARSSNAWASLRSISRGRAFCHGQIEAWLLPSERICMARAALALLGASLEQTQRCLRINTALVQKQTWRCAVCFLRWPCIMAACKVCHTPWQPVKKRVSVAHQLMRRKRRLSANSWNVCSDSKRLALGAPTYHHGKFHKRRQSWLVGSDGKRLCRE